MCLQRRYKCESSPILLRKCNTHVKRQVCCCCSVTKLCAMLWDPMDCSTPACLSLTISWSFPKKKVGAWKKSGSIKTAHFSQRNWVDIGNVHARHTHLLLHHCTLCHELYQNYSGEVCDKLETFDEFSVVIVVNYALHSKPHHWPQALHVTQPGDLGWFHMGAAW